MFAPDNSKSIMARVATSLKIGAMLVLLGLLVIATERPMLLSPPSTVNAAEAKLHARTEAIEKQRMQANDVRAAARLDYLPSRAPGPRGPIEDSSPQF